MAIPLSSLRSLLVALLHKFALLSLVVSSAPTSCGKSKSVRTPGVWPWRWYVVQRTISCACAPPRCWLESQCKRQCRVDSLLGLVIKAAAAAVYPHRRMTGRGANSS
ncbi:hypothetical protein EDB92DRAFT_1907798 [Lactarius akahatsu]|uniref:Secreted protein n=1 Tax=Lactarius akahatsu TaxID=416441 RepID=A0AAD4Q2L6_9AGAM|nr:hypothetical protein EDB92DRAFT_1907798 [Lactarius akahatsu]